MRQPLTTQPPPHRRPRQHLPPPNVVYDVLTKFRNCLVELESNGVTVKLDGLGIFYHTTNRTDWTNEPVRAFFCIATEKRWSNIAILNIDCNVRE